MAVNGAETGSAGPLRLWYRQPARAWVESLPLGNGRLGAMVFGGVEKELIQLNEESIWVGFERDVNNPIALKNLPDVRRLLFEGKELEATELGSKTLMGVPDKVQSYQPLGDLLLEMPAAAGATEYRRELDLDTAVATTTFFAGGVQFTREVFVSAVDQVIVVRIAGSKPGHVSLRVRFERSQEALTNADPSSPGTLVLRGQLTAVDPKSQQNKGLRFEGKLTTEIQGGS